MSRFLAPRLDDRTYRELREELLRRIPVHVPEWTDHSPNDPGIALLELFAWLTENTLYRLNRVPDKAQREFLGLLGLVPKPARSARGLVGLQVARGRFEALRQPPRIEAAPGRRGRVAAGPVKFELQDELTVLPVESRAYIKWAVPLEPAGEGRLEGLEGVRQALADHLGKDAADLADWKPTQTYRTVELPPPSPGEPLRAIPVSQSLDETLWVALLTPEWASKVILAHLGPPPPGGTESDATRARDWLRERLAGEVLSVGLHLDDELCGPDDHHTCRRPGEAPTRLPVVWEIAAGPEAGTTVRVMDARYRRLEIEDDDTAGAARTGVVRLRLPRDPKRFGTWTAADLEDRALDGMGALPPAVQDPEVANRIVTWVRLRRPASEVDVAPPNVRWVGVNVVEVEQAVHAGPEHLGNGTGRSGQRVSLSQRPVLVDDLVLEIGSGRPVEWVRWVRVDDLRVSRPNDPHFVLDPASGEIAFGDGLHGRMPLPGDTIRATRYRHGGGVQGNLPPGSIDKLEAPATLASTLRVDQALATEGGRDAESVERARERIPAHLVHRERAVASADFRALALETPDVSLGRAHVLPRHRPQERVDEVPGVVTLVVVPEHDPLHPDEPAPSATELRRVCEWLEPRRLVTTELYVSPPEYVPVWISVAIEVEPDHGVETVRRWVELGIRQYLAPLPPYGPVGDGWPFGREVDRRDVEAAVLRVKGVRLVRDVRVEGWALPALADAVLETSKITIAPWQLPVVRQVLVTDGEEPEPFLEGDVRPPPGRGGTEPSDPGTGDHLPDDIPIPIEEEVC
ncbi:MAG: putative baseplate assembly protein [Myxococcales bacterium]|nr:putative baseplate assembly protein [Myxococcales bacterium]